MTSFIDEQRAIHANDWEQPRLVPRTVFLPRDRYESLVMIRELLHAVISNTLVYDHVTSAEEELYEILDLIERS